LKKSPCTPKTFELPQTSFWQGMAAVDKTEEAFPHRFGKGKPFVMLARNFVSGYSKFLEDRGEVLSRNSPRGVQGAKTPA
jgi:hypothetical protein